MRSAYSAPITELLRAVREGDAGARDELAGRVFQELRRIARARMRSERKGHTLQPTALVNEACIQLLGQEDKDWQNRTHFFAVAAQVMRRILVDHARASKARKRGGGDAQVPLDFDVPVVVRDIDEALAVDEALKRLEKLAERQARVVELRYYCGLTEDETAEALQVSPRTVKRDWKLARAFLLAELSGHADMADV